VESVPNIELAVQQFEKALEDPDYLTCRNYRNSNHFGRGFTIKGLTFSKDKIAEQLTKLKQW
jgi:hypothetical protein